MPRCRIFKTHGHKTKEAFRFDHTLKVSLQDSCKIQYLPCRGNVLKSCDLGNTKYLLQNELICVES